MNNELKEIVNCIDMELYLDREGLQYKSARGSSGQQLNVKVCPFCNGSQWKVYMNAETGFGNCFSGSCEATFNKYSFIRQLNNGISNGEVIRHIKAIAREQGWRQRKTTKYSVENNIDGLQLPDSIELPFNGKNLKYLTNRGISSEIASYFYLKYSKNGIFRYLDGDQSRSQNYASRIIIPIYDLEGTLVSFQGRDITGQSERKYLFPPGYSSTGKYLYNGHNAIHARHVIICEGVFDVMAVKIAMDSDMELRDVVPIGSFGKHLSNGFGNDQMEQLIKLKSKGLKEVTFMWDGELSAIKSAVRSALIVSRLGLRAKVAVLPKDKDPNEASIYEVIEAFKNSKVINKLSAVRLLHDL